MTTMEKKPRIRVLGEHGMEDIDYDSLPDAPHVAYNLAHHFLPVKISAAWLKFLGAF